MAKRKTFELPKDDFSSEEDCDIYGFTSEPIVTGECISSFLFNDDSTNENDINLTSDNKAAGNVDTASKNTSNIMNFDVSTNDKQNISPKSINYITTQETISSSNTSNTINNTNLSTNKNNILEDNRKVPIVNGMAPPINGEYLNVKRTYMLRASTVRKINELKSIHPDLNTYVSTIVDLAIANYYEHIINCRNQQ